MFDVPPKCPALANKLGGLFGWRHTYKVAAKQEGIPHGQLHKSYSLTLPKRPPSPSTYSCVKVKLERYTIYYIKGLQSLRSKTGIKITGKNRQNKQNIKK